jgi:hypothetical protein
MFIEALTTSGFGTMVPTNGPARIVDDRSSRRNPMKFTHYCAVGIRGAPEATINEAAMPPFDPAHPNSHAAGNTKVK